MAGDDEMPDAAKGEARPVNRFTAALIALAGGSAIATLLIWFFQIDYDAAFTGPLTIRAVIDTAVSVLAWGGGVVTVWRVVTKGTD
tara:strand:- start:585 stop:842 length:258 start_codon:yes stop_codon:yes gene_type:complete